MAKGQKRSSREVKKPKAAKKPTAGSATPSVLPSRPAPTKGGGKRPASPAT